MHSNEGDGVVLSMPQARANAMTMPKDDDDGDDRTAAGGAGGKEDGQVPKWHQKLPPKQIHPKSR